MKSTGVVLIAKFFIPKIKSLKILDLAETMDKKKRIKYLGIRPGEKMHEFLFSSDETNLIYEFRNHYVLAPSISFTHIAKKGYSKKQQAIAKLAPPFNVLNEKDFAVLRKRKKK